MTYTKQRNIMQYTEIVYYRDGEEIARETLNDDHSYDAEAPEPMTEEDIENYG